MTAPFPLHLLSLLYGGVASRRRRWYASHPAAQRRLAHPVVSVGNLTVGGSNKTPVVAHLARLLMEQGERPSILSRGYARRDRPEGVVVVSDPDGVREPVDRSGDEPQLLARNLPGVAVLVADDRYLAGALAERRFGCTVHLLDDGFQHLTLARDIDLLLVSPQDAQDSVLPAGRLREPWTAASAADAVIVIGNSSRPVPGSDPGSDPRFFAALTVQPARRVRAFDEALGETSRRAVAVAGIARPERFFETARSEGWELTREIAFFDHHWFSPADLHTMIDAARATDAGVILTTEKDAVRLAPLLAGQGDDGPQFAFLPIAVSIEPSGEFAPWLSGRLHVARTRLAGAGAAAV